MHPQIRHELARGLTADRVRRASGADLPQRRQHPPPWRGRAAYAAARLAGRLDAESARRAVASG